MVEQLGPEPEVFATIEDVNDHLREVFPNDGFPPITLESIAVTGILSRVVGKNLVTVGRNDEAICVAIIPFGTDREAAI